MLNAFCVRGSTLVCATRPPSDRMSRPSRAARTDIDMKGNVSENARKLRESELELEEAP